jgi:hypothetical protein
MRERLLLDVPRGKVIFVMTMEEKLRPIPARGWAEMIRKVFEVDPWFVLNAAAR